ncbi:class I SAM-dependent methyltransferase [Acidaminobacter sp. JC074]|uniref:class I SAM-dependent methyltransferase n=1 Tax=Acidaminobacter sp. JC074 TaxID=2530199 RepID=UPI001F0DC830|nr:methyltransferase domain-containing protein [Acidaminobacter sp. JC074]
MKKNYKRNEKLASTFDLVAKDFESIGPKYFTHFGHKLVEESGLKEGQDVLDIACGRGASLFKSSELKGLKGRLVGVDFSKEMIKNIRETASEKEIEDLEAYQMDAEKLLFDAETFDCVYCGLSMHFFSSPRLSLEEMYRVLKENGKVAISTWGIKKESGKKGVYERAYEKIFSKRATKGKSREIDLSSVEGLKTFLTSVRFMDVRVVVESKNFYYKSKEEWWTEQSNNATRGFFERIQTDHPDLFMAFKKACFDEVEKEMVEGRIKFEATVLYGYGIKSF